MDDIPTTAQSDIITLSDELKAKMADKISSQEAARILGVHRSTLRSWLYREKGPMPIEQTGWANFYSKQEIEIFALQYRNQRV